MTDLEPQDFEIQFVHRQLKEADHELASWQSKPDVDPSLWFVSDDGTESGSLFGLRPTRKKLPGCKAHGSCRRKLTASEQARKLCIRLLRTNEPLSNEGVLQRGYPLMKDFLELKSIIGAAGPNQARQDSNVSCHSDVLWAPAYAKTVGCPVQRLPCPNRPRKHDQRTRSRSKNMD